MPVYDYRCEPCRTTFEVTRPVSDRSEVLCPECGSAAKRVFSPVGVIFKGSGFYNTDYKRSSDASPSSATGASSDKSEPASCPAADGSSGCAGCAGAESKKD
ncbi:MAG: hypothetical protein Kow0056_02860 [Coriobacteriia bacterium]